MAVSLRNKPAATNKGPKMYQISIKGKKGKVGVAYKFDGAAELYILDQPDQVYFELGEKESTIPNIAGELSSILKQARNNSFDAVDFSKDSKARMMIAVPESLSFLVNNIALFTKVIWSGTMVAEKGANKRPLCAEEKAIYASIFNDYRFLMGRVIIVDSGKTAYKEKEDRDDIGKAWVELNRLFDDTLFAKSGPKAILGNSNLLAGLANDDDDEEEYC